jgi:hypothetical protein
LLPSKLDNHLTAVARAYTFGQNVVRSNPGELPGSGG